jgi:hypothetical protein
MKTKSSAPKRKRNKVLFIAVTDADHARFADLAKANSRTMSEEILKRLKITLGDESDAESAKLAIQILTKQGWIQHHEARHGGNVLLPPGATPSSPFFIDGRELSPNIVASESVERLLRGLFHECGIPPEQRIPLREAVFRALKEITPKEKGGEWQKPEKRTPRVV